MADYAPLYGKPQAVSFTAGATITGGDILYLSAADTVNPAGANAVNYIGVAAHDAATGTAVTVLMGSGVVHETLCNASTAAGALVFAGAASTGQTGAANSSYNVAIGVALRTCMTAHNTLRWKSLIG